MRSRWTARPSASRPLSLVVRLQEKNMKPPKNELPEFADFIAEFNSESDRAAAIIGAAKIDLLLCKTLEKILIKPGIKKDNLLDNDSPIGTFSARINLIYRLGIIDKKFAKLLHIVRKIRNSFAHELLGVNFESEAHKNRVAELICPLKSHDGFQVCIKKAIKGQCNTSTEFRAAIAFITLRLTGIYRRSKVITQFKTMHIVPENWEFEAVAKEMTS